MAKLFGIDLPAVFNTHFAVGLLDATLTVVTPGTRTPGSLSAGSQPTTATKAARGVLEEYSEVQAASSLIQQGDRRILLVANSIAGGAVPKPGDRVTILAVEYDLVNVQGEGGEAIWDCQGRRR